MLPTVPIPQPSRVQGGVGNCGKPEWSTEEGGAFSGVCARPNYLGALSC